MYTYTFIWQNFKNIIDMKPLQFLFAQASQNHWGVPWECSLQVPSVMSPSPWRLVPARSAATCCCCCLAIAMLLLKPWRPVRAQSAAAVAAAAAALLLLPLLLLPAAIFALPCISKKKHALIIFNVSKRRHIYIYICVWVHVSLSVSLYIQNIYIYINVHIYTHINIQCRVFLHSSFNFTLSCRNLRKGPATKNSMYIYIYMLTCVNSCVCP